MRSGAEIEEEKEKEREKDAHLQSLLYLEEAEKSYVFVISIVYGATIVVFFRQIWGSETFVMQSKFLRKTF